ncbi:hypothetical protein DL96DRAFT_1617293 [Flagelloscypha sp. PMI_526]|nr:hypothetical protein DL96DRAFT_1617293 [Flagelloscypha sp. PMI_526]
MITLYDIPSTLPGVVWGPNTLLTRITLEFKGIPFETKWIEYPEIEPTAKTISAEPTTFRPDTGKPKYTVPMIHDASTGTTISDSWNILNYLEETYPDKPSLIPKGTKSLMKVFVASATMKIAEEALRPFNSPQAARIVNPSSQEYFVTVKAKEMSKPFAELEAGASLESVKAALNWVEELIQLNGGEFLVGDGFSYAEVVVGSKIYWSIVHGKDSQLWREIMALNGGRWKRLVDYIEKLVRIEQVSREYRAQSVQT